MRNRLYQLFIITALLGTTTITSSIGQDKGVVVQLSGVVLGEDSITAIQGVHIYVPRYGRGTTTNPYGYFSMPALVGDSVVISVVGYKNQNYNVPSGQGESITKVFQMEVDTLYLENVDILPFPTEEAFKEAILALQLPDETEKLNQSLSGEFMAYMVANTPYGGSINARYFLQQQFYHQTHRYGTIANPFLNPLNWLNFINSIKNGDYKKKKKKS